MPARRGLYRIWWLPQRDVRRVPLTVIFLGSRGAYRRIAMIEHGQEITSAPKFAEFSRLPPASVAPIPAGRGATSSRSAGATPLRRQITEDRHHYP
jgi:hypothetical protein